MSCFDNDEQWYHVSRSIATDSYDLASIVPRLPAQTTAIDSHSKAVLDKLYDHIN